MRTTPTDKCDGLRVAPGHSAGFLRRLERVEMSNALREGVAPLVLLLQGLNEQIKADDERLAALSKKADMRLAERDEVCPDVEG